MSLALSVLLIQSLVASNDAIDSRIVARAQIPPYQVSIVETGQPYTDHCTLELIAESHDARLTADASFRHFKCGVRGEQVLHVGKREYRGMNSVLFETGYGGDGDHTGPVMLFFNLTNGQLKRQGAMEVFSPQISWTDKGVAHVAGQLLFTYCDVCDGPGVVSEEIYVPVDVVFDGYTVESVPRFDAGQAANFHKQFESYGVKLYGENWPTVQEQNDHVIKQFESLTELLGKTGWSDNRPSGERAANDNSDNSCSILPQIERLATVLSDGKAALYPDLVEHHEVLLSDATNKPSPGCVSLFYLGGWGGGNTNRQYLASFVRDGSSENDFRLVDFELVGEKFAGALRIDSAQPGKLFVTTLIQDNHEVLERQGTIRITTRDIAWEDGDTASFED